MFEDNIKFINTYSNIIRNQSDYYPFGWAPHFLPLVATFFLVTFLALVVFLATFLEAAAFLTVFFTVFFGAAFLATFLVTID